MNGSAYASGVKYIYLIIFFVLLSGVFFPLVQNQGAEFVFFGTVTLILGLAGSVMLLKAATSYNRRPFYLGAGFGIISLSLYFILAIAGKAPL